MGTTPNGYSYPEDTDPVSEGAAAIETLARQLPPRWMLQTGNAVITTSSSGKAQIAFPTEFQTARPLLSVYVTGNAAPAVWVNLDDDAMASGGVSAEKFRIILYRHDGVALANYSFEIIWMAMGAIRP